VNPAFETCYGRMRAMMLTSGIDLNQRAKLCVEAASIETSLRDILVGADNGNLYKIL
jgi:hypothetical protein